LLTPYKSASLIVGRERRALRKGPAVAEVPKENNDDNDDDVEMDVSVDENAIEKSPLSNGTTVKETQPSAPIQPAETNAATPVSAPTMPQVLLNSGKSVYFIPTSLFTNSNQYKTRVSRT
jgi:hypothetical protein